MAARTVGAVSSDSTHPGDFANGKRDRVSGLADCGSALCLVGKSRAAGVPQLYSVCCWQIGWCCDGYALGFILAGLLLRIRAFLFVGTAVFIIQVLRQLWRFIDDYSLLLWALGILLGLVFIWVAATFEARRSQISALIQYWVTELEAWE